MKLRLPANYHAQVLEIIKEHPSAIPAEIFAAAVEQLPPPEPFQFTDEIVVADSDYKALCDIAAEMGMDYMHLAVDALKAFFVLYRQGLVRYTGDGFKLTIDLVGGETTEDLLIKLLEE